MLANELKPKNDATITVRIIKSFKYRTERSLVLHHVDLTATTVAQLKQAALQGLSFRLTMRALSHSFSLSHCLTVRLETISHRSPRSLLSRLVFLALSFCHPLDTLKLYTKAHGAKVALLSSASFAPSQLV